jgi:small subunit ribosomal protein S1
MKQDNNFNFNNENFEALFKQSVAEVKRFEDNIVKGVVVGVDQYYLTVDVGLKSEGKILINEFKDLEGKLPEFKLGQEVEVYVERYEDQEGNIVLSREKAKREEVWVELEKLYAAGTPVQGFVSKRVKGGFAVLVQDTLAFLPGSQLDVKPIKNINSLVGTTQTLQILKMDKKRFNIVVSRKAIVSKNIAENNPDYNTNFEEGQIVEGIVKNITGYGAFVDLGAVDGLIHITDISWSRVNHPSEILQVGQTIKVKVIKINPDDKRISLGMKQLFEDPWNEVINKYNVGGVFKVKVTNIADYGIFVELAKGAEGLVHVSELSWTRKDIDLKATYKVGDEVEVKVLDVDHKKRRMALSIKRCQGNPWLEFINQNPEGKEISVEVKEINDAGLLVKLDTQLESFIRISDISWESKEKEVLNNYKVGDKISAKVIRFDSEKDKIYLGIKQLSDDPMAGAFESVRKGSIVKAKVTSVSENGLDVVLDNGITAFIKRADLSLDREDQKIENFVVDQEIEAIVLQLNNSNKTATLSIKALELNEQKKNMSSGEESGNSFFAEAFAEAMSKKDQNK